MMSAFLVNDTHIDALLTYAMRPRWQSPAKYYHDDKQSSIPTTGRTFFDNLDLIGQVLIDQNFASVNGRYGETEAPGEYKFTKLLEAIRTVAPILKHSPSAVEILASDVIIRARKNLSIAFIRFNKLCFRYCKN